MKNFRNFFVIIALCLVSAFNASAQSMDDMAKQAVAEMVNALNEPSMKNQLMQEAGLSKFSATADGKTLVMNMYSNDPDADFSILSPDEKAELSDSFSDMLVEGITEGSDGQMVLSAFKLLGIKVRVNLYDVYGNLLTKTVDFNE